MNDYVSAKQKVYVQSVRTLPDGELAIPDAIRDVRFRGHEVTCISAKLDGSGYLVAWSYLEAVRLTL